MAKSSGTKPQPIIPPRRIAHFDLDTFFVSVERARNPALVGKPVLVGGNGDRGVVAAASYEARRFGCHSAQPMSHALRLCPDAVIVTPDKAEYSRISMHFHDVLRAYSPYVDSVGLDEAYVDLTSTSPNSDGALQKKPSKSAEIAEAIRTEVRQDLGIAVSVCIAGSRTTAKVGSDRAKPDGLIEVPLGKDAEFLAPVPIRDLPMVGPKLAESLRVAGVKTIGDLANIDRRWLVNSFGRIGEVLHTRANGLDAVPIGSSHHSRKSISRERTFDTDVIAYQHLRNELARQTITIGTHLRTHQQRARTITLKLRWKNFETITRSRTVTRPIYSTKALLHIGGSILDSVLHSQRGVATAEGINRADLIRPVRLIGITAGNLVSNELQLTLDDLHRNQLPSTDCLFKEELLDDVIDTLRSRFGQHVVKRGVEPT